MLHDKKTLIKLALVITLVSVFIFFSWLISKNNKIKKDSLDNVSSEDILIQIGDIYQKVSLPSGNVSQANAIERNDFGDFIGLPKKEDKYFYENFSVIYSEDKDKIALVSFIGAEDGADKQKEFACILSEKKCQEEKIFFNKYSLDGLALDASALWWLGWNSRKNTAIGLTTDGVNNGTLYVCDIKTALCKKNSADKINFPNGALNKSLDRIIAIKQNDIANEKIGDTWELILYNITDLSTPIKSYDISKSITKDDDLIYDGVNSVAWSNDNKSILIGTLKNIFKFDLEKDKLEKIFTDSSDSEDDTYWNSDSLEFSSSGRYAIFVDNIGTEQTSEENENMPEEEMGILKIIDLENNNKVIELLQAQNLVLK